MAIDIVLLLGPNGAGKSTLGRLLEQQCGWPFLSCEEFFLTHYRTLEDYYADRDHAYSRFEQVIRTTLREKGGPVVVEEVGLSPPSQAMIRSLLHDYAGRILRLVVDPAVAVERVGQRGLARNYPKDRGFVQATWQRFAEQIEGLYTIDMVLDTTYAPETLSEQIRRWVHSQVLTTPAGELPA